jgi:hypothetical protein
MGGLKIASQRHVYAHFVDICQAKNIKHLYGYSKKIVKDFENHPIFLTTARACKVLSICLKQPGIPPLAPHIISCMVKLQRRR